MPSVQSLQGDSNERIIEPPVAEAPLANAVIKNAIGRHFFIIGLTTLNLPFALLNYSTPGPAGQKGAA
jgi:hypothetical protein